MRPEVLNLELAPRLSRVIKREYFHSHREAVGNMAVNLDRALAERDATLTSIKSDPLLRKLQSDPRYAALLRKVGLPP